MLSWHVDYWDRLGWKDPFASEQATRRQKAYRAARELPYLVTPQFFVDNEAQRGSTVRAALTRAVEDAADQEPVLDATIGTEWRNGRVGAKVALEALADDFEPGRELVARAVLFARRSSTEVPRGENAGRTLVDWFAVCDAAKAVPVARALENPFEVVLRAPAGSAPANLGVAVLVEDPEAVRTRECWWVPVATE